MNFVVGLNKVRALLGKASWDSFLGQLLGIPEDGVTD
jgi:hypothetical protein